MYPNRSVIELDDTVASTRMRNWQGLLFLYGMIVLQLSLTWGRWAEPIIDFGRELYIPWQLSEGQVLYQDIAYFNGPASPYFNALLFKLFGTSITTLVLANTVILAATVTLAFANLRKLFPFGISLFACASFLLIQGFGHSLECGVYNYISPYSHEMTHGVFLSMLVLFLLHRGERRSWWQLLLSGVAWGFAFLMKPEFFLAISGLIFVSFLAPLFESLKNARILIYQLSITVLGSLLSIGSFYLFLSTQLQPQNILPGICGSWYWLLTTDVSHLHFYKARSGFDNTFHNITLLVRNSVGVVILLAAISLFIRRKNGKQIAIATAMALIAMILTQQLFPIVINPHFVLVFTAFIAFVAVYKLLSGTQHKPNRQAQLLVSWGVLASLLFTKILLNPNITDYGFALGMPALILTIAATLNWLPEYFCRDEKIKRCRAVFAGVLVLQIAAFGILSAKNINLKSNKLATSEFDQLSLNSSIYGTVVNDTLSFLELESDSSIIAFPEGVMLNYLLRCKNPSPYVNFMPPELVMFGEEQMVKRFRSNPSEYVLLVNRPVPEYDKDYFGEPGYGDQIMRWVNDNYQVEKIFGQKYSPTFDQFGITIMKKKPLEPQPSVVAN